MAAKSNKSSLAFPVDDDAFVLDNMSSTRTEREDPSRRDNRHRHEGRQDGRREGRHRHEGREKHRSGSHPRPDKESKRSEESPRRKTKDHKKENGASSKVQSRPKTLKEWANGAAIHQQPKQESPPRHRRRDDSFSQSPPETNSQTADPKPSHRSKRKDNVATHGKENFAELETKSIRYDGEGKLNNLDVNKLEAGLKPLNTVSFFFFYIIIWSTLSAQAIYISPTFR